MDRDLTDLMPDEVMERWEVLYQKVMECWEAVAEVLVPAFQQVRDATYELIIQLRRFQLQYNLVHHWRMPNHFAYWLSDKWPERWLPELRFTE